MTPDDLRSLRKSLGLTQTEFADALDISRTQIARYELGTAAIPKIFEMACKTLKKSRQKTHNSRMSDE